MSRCFILNRVSTSAQRDNLSITIQRKIHPRIADELGCTYTKDDIFDLDVSSTTYDRDKWNAVKKAIASGRYANGYGIFGAIDRYHRDKDEWFEFLTHCIRQKITVVIPDTYSFDLKREIPIQQYNPDKFKDLIQLVFEIEEAESFKKKLRSRVKRSLSHARSIGIDLGATGLPTLGYTWDSKRQVIIGGRGYGKWIVNPKQKELVREIFTTPLSNVQMAIQLNKKGYRNTLGSSFNTANVSRIRKRLRYAGKMKNDNGDIIDTLNVEPIVTYEEFLSAQRYGKRMKEYRGRNAKYKMIGLVHCGFCIQKGLKGQMVRKAWKFARSEQVRMYCDSTRYLPKSDRCPAFSKGLVIDRLFNLVIADLSQKMSKKNILSKAFNDYLIKLSKKNNDGEISSLAKRISALEKKIQNLTRAVADGFDRSSAIKEMNRIKSEQEILIEQRTQLQTTSAKKLEIESVQELHSVFREFFRQKMSRYSDVEINSLLKFYIDSIHYFIDHVVINYRFFPPKRLEFPYLDFRFKENRSPRYKSHGKDPVANVYPINNVRIKSIGK